MTTDGAITNVLTVDVEDWIQSVHDVTAALTDRFVRNTHVVLEMLAERGVKATFFMLGLAAEKSPELVRAIHEAGHEVQSHGHGHRLVHTQTSSEFRADAARSKRVIEDIIGAEVSGYRAPAFSITERTAWALDVLVEEGFRYDSSIFPVAMRRYGIAGTPRGIHRRATPGGSWIVEAPVCCWRVGGVRVPAGGGGYLRTWPWAVTRGAIRQTNAAGESAVVYIHPYEFAANEIAELGVSISPGRRLHQTLGRSSVPRKVGRMLDAFRFGRLDRVLSAWSASRSSMQVEASASIAREPAAVP